MSSFSMILNSLSLATFLVAALANPVAPVAPAAPVAPVAPAAPQTSCTNIQLVIGMCITANWDYLILNSIFLARGTTEPGTFGEIVGDPLYAATVSKFGSYASVSGYAVNV
jgi:hypothetical protein